ncbi:hypothetical protein INT45_012575, partial [Circinella minor]
DAMFVVDPDDRSQVEKYLNKKGLKWNDILDTNPSWILRRVKRIVPPATKLGPIVQDLFNEYGNVVCLKTGRKLFDKDAWAQADRMIKSIYNGEVSDHPEVPLYYKVGFDKKAGLPLYRCSRGTNSLEGGIHANIVRAIGASGAGAEMADCFLAEYRLRHNIKVGSLNRYQEQHKGHYDIWMMEALLHLRLKLGISGSGGAIARKSVGIYLQGLHLKPSNETFGISRFSERVANDLGICTQKNHQQEYHSNNINPSSLKISVNLYIPTGSTANPLNSRYNFLAQKQGTTYAVTPVHTKQEYQKFNKIITETMKNGPISLEKFIILAKKEWNESTSTPVDGATIFYKTAEQLKAQYERWNNKRLMDNAIKEGLCQVVQEKLQSKIEVSLFSVPILHHHHLLNPQLYHYRHQQK